MKHLSCLKNAKKVFLVYFQFYLFKNKKQHVTNKQDENRTQRPHLPGHTILILNVHLTKD